MKERSMASSSNITDGGGRLPRKRYLTDFGSVGGSALYPAKARAAAIGCETFLGGRHASLPGKWI